MDDFYDDCLYHNASNSLASCDKVQVESVSSWLPHDENPMSFQVNAKEEERLEWEPLIEKPPDPNKHSKKKKEEAFNIGELIYLNYLIH